MSDGVVARGRIKVDARKALDKLRDHMLVDPHLWACEIARVAVALGATRLDVDWDNSGLTFDFDGRGLAVERIAHARDHVLTPLEGSDGDALRVLGIGIGAALSLDPSYVEVVAAGQRVRFERRYMEDGELAPTPSPATEALPNGATMRVRFERRLGFGFLARLGGTPEEIPLLRDAFEAPSCALRLRGAVVPRGEQPVLTVDLDVPGTTRAQLELLRRPTEARVDFLHYGVRIVSSTVRGLWGLATRPGARLPVRVLIDATDLPTNASRSQVRHDAPLIERAFRRVDPAFEVAIGALRGEAQVLAAKVGHVVTTHAEPPVLVDVLGAIAAEAMIAHRAKAMIDPRARQLLDDRVAFDALGRRISLRSIPGGTHDAPVRIYDGPQPLPEDLEPWLTGTVWRRGLSAERALDGLYLASVKDLVEPALVAMQRRMRALEHPASKPLTSSSDASWKETFSVSAGPFAGLEGEVALRAGRALATVRLYVDDRLLETVSAPGVHFPVELALSWPRHIVAGFAYESVERNEELGRALQYALRVAAIGVGRHGAEPALLRAATETWAAATRALGDGQVEPGALAELASTPAWRTNDGKLVTLAAIYGYGRLTGAVCFATSSRPAPDGRILVAASDAPALRQILGSAVELVAYDRALAGDHDALEAAPSLAVMFTRPGIDGFIAPNAEKYGRVRVYHAGTCVRRETWPARNGAIDVVYVDRAAIPSFDLGECRYASPLPDLAVEEDELVEIITHACETDAVPYEAVEGYLQDSRDAYLARKQNKPLTKRIHALPQRREQQRLARLKSQVLARAPIDVDAIVGGRLRGTVVASGKGAVSVALAPMSPATVLFQGHPLGTEIVGRLDVEAFIDVVDESFVDEWTRLSDVGREWAESAIVEASVSLLDTLAANDGFVESEVALRLTLALLPESPMRVGAIVGRAKWPTVQGTALTLGDAVEVNTGVNRYGPWRPGQTPDESPYDAPAIYLPLSRIGELRRKVFASAGITLKDVTDATTRLQARRAKTNTSAPTLDGPPADPRLRRSLAHLGATFIEGEIELIDAAACDVGRVGITGVREPVPIETGCPVRVVYRSETDDIPTAAREIVEATRTLLRLLVPQLDELPRFVARRVRGMVLAGVAQTGKMTDEDCNIPIFEATTGRWYRLAFLQGYASYTTDPPPYPPLDDETLFGGRRGFSDGRARDIVLCLDRSEASALSKVFELRDDTQALRAWARGLAARAAPPLAEIRVRERDQCLFFIEVNEEGVKGEIGLLHPTHVASRRIELYSTNRPVTFMPDPEGWPVLAALNDDALEVDEAFSAVLDPKKETSRFHQLVRRLVGSRISQLLVAPSDTLGVIRLPVPLLLRSVRGKRTAAAMGVFWIPEQWPERPSIHVVGIGTVAPDRVPLREAGSAPSRVVPVCGKLWVTAEANEISRAVEDVMAWVSVRVAARVDALEKLRKSLALYQWDLALLGVLEDGARDPLAELAKDRPDDDLMHVVARRAPHLVDRQTGDAPTAPTHVQHASIDDVVDVDVEPGEGFLAGLVRRVTELVTGGPQVLEETPLTAALSQALGNLALTGQPVLHVQASKKGRPVTYLRDARKLVVNAKHPFVEAHARRPNGLLFLVLAALSEINRELVEVTDAEEVAKIYDLLRANES